VVPFRPRSGGSSPSSVCLIPVVVIYLVRMLVFYSPSHVRMGGRLPAGEFSGSTRFFMAFSPDLGGRSEENYYPVFSAATVVFYLDSGSMA